MLMISMGINGKVTTEPMDGNDNEVSKVCGHQLQI